MSMLKRIVFLLLACVFAGIATGCVSYQGVAKTGDNKAIVVGHRIIFGALPRMWIVDLNTKETNQMEVEW